jgi:hypothetical protein
LSPTHRGRLCELAVLPLRTSFSTQEWPLTRTQILLYQLREPLTPPAAYHLGMNPLESELRRLYLLGDGPANKPCLMTTAGNVRAMVLELSKPADWNGLSTVWQRVQSELELPAPAIAVSGKDGYQLWFSLAEPLHASKAIAFLESLRQRYLSSIAPERISVMPTATEHAELVPTLQATTGQWSAFVAPDLAAIFSDSPGLDVCPSPESQAKILARLECIKPKEFEAALNQFAAADQMAPNEATPSLAGVATGSRHANLDAKHFLSDVMNDKSIEMHLRIEAAKALLPYS